MAYDVIDHEPGIDSKKAGKSITKETLKGQIEFRKVNFRYPMRKELQVLSDFSAVLEAGKTTALVGPSGSGKSTIIQMIERFYAPVNGEILLDGVPIEDYQLKELRRCIGYVSQEPVLFNTSIRENLLFANPDADEKEMIEALKKAKAWEFVEKMGLDTNVGAAGG